MKPEQDCLSSYDVFSSFNFGGDPARRIAGGEGFHECFIQLVHRPLVGLVAEIMLIGGAMFAGRRTEIRPAFLEGVSPGDSAVDQPGPGESREPPEDSSANQSEPRQDRPAAGPEGYFARLFAGNGDIFFANLFHDKV